MKEWVNVTNYFSERKRHYNHKYLEIDEVYDDLIEVSFFSSNEDRNEIFFSFDKMYGTIHVSPEEADQVREKVKKELVEEYIKNKKPSKDFINSFCEKYHVNILGDVFFALNF